MVYWHYSSCVRGDRSDDWGDDRRSDGRVGMGSYGSQCLVGTAVVRQLVSYVLN